MEQKHKVIIAVLALALIFIVAISWYTKPKKYDKNKTDEQQKKNETESTPIVVNNNIDTDSIVEAVRNITPKQESTVIEKITAEDCADRMYNAMLGHGTDTRALLQCFDYIDNDSEFDEVMDTFEQKYEEPFDEVLAREMFSGKIIANKINEMLAERNIERIITIE